MSAPAGLRLLVFTCGCGTLGAEIAAARLLAPHFGASTIVWANTIAVVLVALSAGAWAGGRLADARPSERDLRGAALLGGVAIALVPFAAGPVLAPVAAAFEDVRAGNVLGSLAAVLLLVGVPLAALGTVTPWALRLVVPDVAHAGRTAGRLTAIGTLGSLAGVFAAALVLIPLLGTQRTFVLLGGMVVAVAARPAVFGRRALAIPAAVFGLVALPPGVTKPSGRPVLAEAETPYQYARIVADGDRRLLELNEGQAIHSVFDPATPLTGGVWDGYAVLPFAVLERPPRRMAMLGNAGGTVARLFGRYYASTLIDGVELDPVVSRLGRRYLGLGSSNARCWSMTRMRARFWLGRRPDGST